MGRSIRTPQDPDIRIDGRSTSAVWNRTDVVGLRIVATFATCRLRAVILARSR